MDLKQRYNNKLARQVNMIKSQMEKTQGDMEEKHQKELNDLFVSRLSAIALAAKEHDRKHQTKLDDLEKKYQNAIAEIGKMFAEKQLLEKTQEAKDLELIYDFEQEKIELTKELKQQEETSLNKMREEDLAKQEMFINTIKEQTKVIAQLSTTQNNIEADVKSLVERNKYSGQASYVDSDTD